MYKGPMDEDNGAEGGLNVGEGQGRVMGGKGGKV